MFTEHLPINSINTQTIACEAMHESDYSLSDDNDAQCASLPADDFIVSLESFESKEYFGNDSFL